MSEPASPLRLPRLYAIADAEVLRRRGVGLRAFASDLRAAGVRLVQWRDKVGSPQEVLAGAGVVLEVFEGTGCRLILNDRVDLAVLAGFGGVHVGQGDLSPEDARSIGGTPDLNHAMKPHALGTQSAGGFWVGVSTHTDEQVRLADLSCADYVAVGPVFVTGTKLDAEPVIGLDGVRRARGLTSKPIVAIGGITLENAQSVLDAGADSIAVISGLLGGSAGVESMAREFLEILA